ncbi:hypothetical protein ACIA5D_36520 [Actinoplanes sp. NPDC051513]|uniref:hypothetical protein n=1 Tax=Actinoplanes sp. NPDC051513 TaxID=3363908 RepID=UPI0037A6C76B
MSRRPEVELSDAAARYVEEHPAVIEELAAGGTKPALSSVQKARLRARLNETREFAASAEGQASAAAFLARYAGR